MAETILVVEDDHDIREAFSEVLIGEGYRVIAVGDGEAAIARMRLDSEPAVDLILLDLVMPKLDGWEFLLRLDVLGLPSPPVIAISAMSDTIARPLPTSARVVATVRKPVELEALLAAVASQFEPAGT